jgi:hypothetical protein
MIGGEARAQYPHAVLQSYFNRLKQKQQSR